MTYLTNRPNFNAPWTDEQTDALVAMIAEGKSIQEIAKELGRSQEAVRGRAWKRGLLQRKTR